MWLASSLLLALIVGGQSVYLTEHIVELEVARSQWRPGQRLIPLHPYSYLGLDLSSRVDYNFPNRGAVKYVRINSAGLLYWTKKRPGNVVVETASASFMGNESSTRLRVRLVNSSEDSCTNPTPRECFAGNFTFRLYPTKERILLGHVGPIDPPHCFNISYNVTVKPQIEEYLEVVSGDLWFRGSQAAPQADELLARVSCSLAGPRSSAQFSTTFKILLQKTVALPTPLAQTRTLLVDGVFPVNKRLLLGTFWLAQGSNYTLRFASLTPFSKPELTLLPYSTYNVKASLLLLEMSWFKEEKIQGRKTLTVKLDVTRGVYLEPVTVEVTAVLLVLLPPPLERGLPRVQYPSRELSLGWAPYSRHTQPLGNLTRDPRLRFRSAVPPFLQSPLDVTPAGGIVYLKPWAPHLLPCDISVCPTAFLVEWELYPRRLVGSQVFFLQAGRGPAEQCEGSSRSVEHWTLCAEHPDPESCRTSCGPAVPHHRQGDGVRCSWRGADRVPQGVPTTVAPLDQRLTSEYFTCRADPVHCPDSWCDPLEALHNSICPQDCTRDEVALGTRGAHNRGIGSGVGYCTCSQSAQCVCGPVPRFDKLPPTQLPPDEYDNQVGEESAETLGMISMAEEGNSVGYTRATHTEKCDTKCKILGSIGASLILGILCSAVYLKKKKWREGKAGREHYSTDPLVPLQTFEPHTPQQQVPEIDTKWEVPRSRIEISDCLGEGEFGKVLKATAKDLPFCQGLTVVAVKTLKENSGSTEYNDLMSEYQLLKEVNHPNVIKLLGACTTREGPVYIIIEYCSLGSLRNYLRSSHKAKLLQDNNVEVSSKEIIGFSWQICKGMAYLADMKLVHRDLATRNILLNENKMCKISDFGMTRDVYVDDTYLKVSRGRVPVKWMALESLRDHVYTSKSDVWSFGVVLWELVTLGSSPYPGVPVENLYNLLRSGYRMTKPPHCSPILYEIMRECWATEAARRPSFAQLTDKFEKMLEQEIEYLSFNNINAFSNPAYFMPHSSGVNGENFNIQFSMSFEELDPGEGGQTVNLYENENIPEKYDVPKPIKSPYVKMEGLKNVVIEEKVDNR